MRSSCSKMSAGMRSIQNSRKQFLFTMLPVVFLGGFFYQLISEGKAQYIIPYFILMTGFAAFGAVSFYDTVMKKVQPDSPLGRICAPRFPAAETAGEADAADAEAVNAEDAAASGKAEAEAPEQTADPAPAEKTASGAKKNSGKQQSKRKKGAKK